MFYSIIIPARNEEECVGKTIRDLLRLLRERPISFEIVVVNDGSTDRTEEIVKEITARNEEVRYVWNGPYHGYALAVRKGLEVYRGDAVAIVMADSSDEPQDVIRYYDKLEEGYDCVFGSRFMRGSVVKNYPLFKLALNRIANTFIAILFGARNNDLTNSFKAYRRETIEGLKPILSHHFNLSVELPLKAVARGYSYATVPINWYGRESGMPKFKIKEMTPRYIFIILYVLLEKWLSKGDYKRRDKKEVKLNEEINKDAPIASR